MSSTPIVCFFNGAMDILQPKIDDGTLVVTSGQTSFDQVSTEGWKKEKAQERMENLITNYYSDGTDLSGVLSPNDQLAEGILNAATAAKLTPVVTGQDSEVVAVTRVAAGEQYSTIYKDTRKLVAETVALVTAVCGGEVYPTTAEFTTDGGVAGVDVTLARWAAQRHAALRCRQPRPLGSWTGTGEGRPVAQLPAG